MIQASDFYYIWQLMFQLVVSVWNYLYSFANGLILALVIVAIAGGIVKRIFFRDSGSASK